MPCPICGHDYVHLDGIGVKSRDVGHELGVIEIQGTCEGECSFTLTLAQHKGQIRASAEGKRAAEH